MTQEWKQFLDIASPVSTFEGILKDALQALVRDAADAPWLLREREMINRLVFRHLVPCFQSAGLDIAQIAIEVALRKSCDTNKEKLTSGGDLVIWPHCKATVWNCCKPLARIEWKNISCREKNPEVIEQAHLDDIKFLMQNSELATLNFAVLTMRRAGQFRVVCEKVAGDGSISFFCDSHPATGDASELQKLTFVELLSCERHCPQCLTMNGGDEKYKSCTAGPSEGF